MFRSFLGLAAAFLAAGCSASADVYGVLGDDNEIFTGTTTGYSNRTGTIQLRSDKGTQCVGEFAYTSAAAGRGLLTCNDGQRALIQFNSLTRLSGYGFGTSNTGKAVKFTYGLSQAESAKYIGTSPAHTTGTTSGAAAATPPSRERTGSGFFVSRQGHVLTNAHVVDKCRELTLSRQGSGPVAASVVSTDASNDLAVLKAASPAPTVAAFRAGRSVRQGESIVAYGFPLSGTLSSGGSLTAGSVSALSGLGDDTRYLQISAPVQAGSSGGPLLDTSGHVVGVVSSQLNALRVARAIGGSIPQNVNFAIKADVARTFLQSAGIGFETATSSREISTPDLGEEARGFTVLVGCKG